MKKFLRLLLICCGAALLCVVASSNQEEAREASRARLQEQSKAAAAVTPVLKATARSASKAAAQSLTYATKAPVRGPTARPVVKSDRDWQKLIAWPTDAEIDESNSTAALRSPYLYAWLTVNRKYTQYTVDFKADYVPNGTYCCLGQFDLDYSALKKTYKSYKQEYQGVAGYAGLQRLENGEMKAILSFWDVNCTTKKGQPKTIRATLIYPAGKTGDSFGGEGTGAHYLADYDWQPGRWYRMKLQIGTSKATGNTTVEQSFQDLTTKEWTKTCAYDLGVKSVKFQGSACVFLENFAPRYAGEIRTMECKNFKIVDSGKRTVKLTGIEAGNQEGAYQGSASFGVEKDTLYMITTGVTGKAAAQKTAKLKLK